MIKRKLVILLLIICFVLSLQAAFASNDLNNTDASAYSSIDSNDDLKIDNADSFSQLQYKVNDGGVINLDRNYSFNVVNSYSVALPFSSNIILKSVSLSLTISSTREFLHTFSIILSSHVVLIIKLL